MHKLNTFSKNIQDLIHTLTGMCFLYLWLPKWGLNLADLLENMFNLCMDVTTQLELCLHEQTQIVANAACRVGS